MKMHAIIVKQGFAVIVAFCSNICLFKNPVPTILKVVGSEDCVQENKFAPSCWAVFAIFFEKRWPFQCHFARF